MALVDTTAVRQCICELLERKGDNSAVADSDPLFTSGRLDSLAAVEILVFLETRFAIDFTRIDFDIDLIQSIDAIVSLISAS